MAKGRSRGLYRIVLWMLLLHCGMSCFIGCGSGAHDGEGSSESVNIAGMTEKPELKVTFFDVGKGDAILIETAEHKMLIDAGYDDTAGTVLDYLAEGAEGSRLDYLILTHFDKDHVGGADHIVNGVEIGEILQPDYETGSKQYQEYEEAVKGKGAEPLLVTETMKLSLDGAEFLVYPPQQEDYEEEDNDFSLVISMKYGERSFLFAGDCERERLKELLGQDEFELAHDVLKVPHHGRTEKNSEEFLKAVSPKIAVITCSEEKPADEEICRMLEELGTDTYFSLDGTVTCLCDGERLEILVE